MNQVFLFQNFTSKEKQLYLKSYFGDLTVTNLVLLAMWNGACKMNICYRQIPFVSCKNSYSNSLQNDSLHHKMKKCQP